MTSQNQEEIFSVIGNIVDAVVIIDHCNIVIFANQSAERLWAHESGDLIGSDASILFPPELRSDERTKGAAILADPLDGYFGSYPDVPLRRSGGQEFWANVSISCAKIAGLDVHIVVARDIEERQRHRSKIDTLLETTTIRAEQLAIVAERANDAVMIMDEAFKVVWCNAAFTQLSGYDLAEIAGKRPGEFLRGPRTDFEAIARLQQAVAMGQSHRTELLNYSKSGDPYWVEIDITPVGVEHDVLTGFIAIERDVTETKAREIELLTARREAEQHKAEALIAKRQLEEAIGALDDGFVYYDNQDRLMIFNKAYEDILGPAGKFLREGESYEEQLRDLVKSGIVPNIEGKEEAFIQGLLTKRRSERGVDKTFQNHEGRWLRQRDKRTPSGAMVGMRIDVTELKAREAELQTAQTRAEVANRAKSAFLANMSHEIRTPMNGIIGMAELLSETDLTGEQQLCVRTLVDSSAALLTIINDILDFSKIEAEKLHLTSEPFSLNAVLHDIVQLMIPKAEEQGIELCIDYPDTVPESFVGDPGRTRQVLMNLVGNAVKFTDCGHVTISVSYDQNAADLPLKISVRDTGIGIPSDALDKIFSAFEQVESHAARQFEGTGLGLAISGQLVSLMGGEINVRSVVGEGAEFNLCLDLPLEQPDPEAVTLGENGRTDLRQKRIVVVDDLAESRRILGHRLGCWGADVLSFDTPQSFLAAEIGPGDADLILMDYNMPGQHGVDTFTVFRDRALASGQAVVPTVLYSSNEQAHRKSALLELGFSRVLTKPAPSHVLFNALTDALAQRVGPVLPESNPAPSDTTSIAGRRILIAEDNRTNRLVLQKMLMPTGATLIFAENGREAVDAFAAHDVDLVLMDMSMPVMDGLEATRLMRRSELTRRIDSCPIIALTANAMRQDQELCFAAGMTAFLSKPVRKRALLECIDNWLCSEQEQRRARFN